MIDFVLANHDSAKRVATIAAPIWREHYESIIGMEQIDYMLNKFQSEEAIQQQISEGYVYTIVTWENKTTRENKDAGYMATQVRDETLFISKFYLNKNFRGLGLAKPMLQYIDTTAEKNHCKKLELTVNKDNPAYEIYLKLGFENVESIVMDIGNNYVMDDYRMVKNIKQ